MQAKDIREMNEADINSRIADLERPDQVTGLQGQVGPARLDPGHQVRLDRRFAGSLEKSTRNCESTTDQGLEALLMELVGAPHPPILAAPCRSGAAPPANRDEPRPWHLRAGSLG